MGNARQVSRAIDKEVVDGYRNDPLSLTTESAFADQAKRRTRL